MYWFQSFSNNFSNRLSNEKWSLFRVTILFKDILVIAYAATAALSSIEVDNSLPLTEAFAACFFI